jgi:hypothetical protein
LSTAKALDIGARTLEISSIFVLASRPSPSKRGFTCRSFDAAPRVSLMRARCAKQDFGKVESGFPTKILRKQKTLSRDALAGQRISA